MDLMHCGIKKGDKEMHCGIYILPIFNPTMHQVYDIFSEIVLVTYPVYSLFFEYNVSRSLFADLLIMYDVLIQRLSWCF